MSESVGGAEAVWTTDGRLELAVATTVGPRVLAFRLKGAENVLAELGALGIERDAGEQYTFYGGHRLWVAPEVPAITYMPDDGPVTVESGPGSITVVDESGPFAKVLTVTIVDGLVRMDHRLTNQSAESVTAAAWAITQLRPGGIARLPLGSAGPDHVLQPDRLIVGWPYSHWNDPLIELGRDEITFWPGRTSATKFGAAVGGAPLVYEWSGHRFAKWVEPPSIGTYGDLGASGQIYANDRFVELETLSPLVHLDPGASVAHNEWWSLDRL